MDPIPIVVVGASGHGRVIVDILEKQGGWRLIGFLDSFLGVGHQLSGYEVIGTEMTLPHLRSLHPSLRCLVAIGDNATRRLVVDRIRTFELPGIFATAVHPAACIGRDVALGEGTVVMAGAIVNPNTHIGEHCIVNTNASIDHDNVWGDFSSAGPGATTGGNVQVGEGAVIAQRASVLQGRTVGRAAVVGAASTVIHAIPAYVVAYGTPARVVRTRSDHDKYL